MIVGGTQTEILAAALRGLEAQRQAAEHNIANIETPGFKARRVSFESALRNAINTGDPSGARISTSLSDAPSRIDGSNVDLEDEVTSLEVNALQQQLINEALNAQYTRLRTAIGSR
ncbi:MAG: flagellar basal body rod protein FlgB [Acidimicrobiales bacterium]